MTYEPTVWEDLPSTSTPVDASNLNNIEAGVVSANQGRVNVRDYGLVGDGSTDDTTAFTTLLNAVSINGNGTITNGAVCRLFFPAGQYVIDNAQIGNSTHGIRVFIEGEHEANTYIIPKTSSNPAITFRGTGNTQANFFKWQNLSLRVTADRAYSVPVVKIQNTRNIQIDSVYADSKGFTATGFILDVAYQGKISNYNFGTQNELGENNKWFQPLSIRSLLVPNVQEDTFEISNCVWSQWGAIIFGATDWHCYFLRHVKVLHSVVSDPTSGGESLVTTGSAIGDTTLNVTAGDGNTQFVAGAPILVGRGQAMEAAKVATVSANSVTVTQPLEFAHPTGDPIHAWGFVAAFGTNVNSVLVEGCHAEKITTSFILDAVQNFTSINCYNGAREFVRIIGASKEATIGATRMDGPSGANVVCHIPSWNTNANLSRLSLIGPFDDSVTTISALLDDPGSNLNSKAYEVRHQTSGVPYVTRNVATAGAASADLTLTNGGTEKFKRDHQGFMTFLTDRVIQWGTGSPEGVVTSNIGGLYLRTNGGAGSTLYIKESGTGNTGWVAK